MVWPTDSDEKLGEYDLMELPGQQLSANNAYTPLDHLLNLDIKAPAGCQRLTTVIATIGKASEDVDVMEKMMAAGMNIALLNMSFGNREEHVQMIKMLRQAAKNFSITMGKIYPLGIAIQLPGRKIRTGMIAETINELLKADLPCKPLLRFAYVDDDPLGVCLGDPGVLKLVGIRHNHTAHPDKNPKIITYGDTVELKAGDVARLTTDETYKERCSQYTIYLDFLQFSEQLKKGDLVLLDNENIMLKVEIISSTTVTCKVERGGLLGSYKDVFVPNVTFDMPNLTDRDKSNIEFAVKNQVDIIVASFVNMPDAISELKDYLGEKGKKIAILANIQTLEGYKNYDSILSIVNGVIITRQELGSDITPKKLVIAQKNMIARANKANVPVSISAHLLSSMRYKKIPLRAELLDVANCILDGADSMILTAETAVGLYPVETISYLAGACKEAEACVWTKQLYRDLIRKVRHLCPATKRTALGAVLAAQRVIAAAIIVVTSTGRSAQLVSLYRPRCPIIGVTRYAPVARQLHLWRGIIPLIYEDSPDVDWQHDLEKRVNFCTKWAMGVGFVRVGDPLIVVSGWKQGSGFTNTMRIVYTAADTTAS